MTDSSIHENKLPDDKLPDDKLPDDKLPDDKLPDDKLPEYNLTLPGFDNEHIKVVTNSQYKVLTYNKALLRPELAGTYGLCRSIVFDNNNRAVSFAPPKSIAFETFSSMYPDISPLIAQQFVEGTMINLFWDASRQVWELTTRNMVGAASSFYNKMTFREMFNEAAEANSLFVSMLDKTICYSFVVQHPNNRIVVPVKDAQLYLVAAYTIENSPGKICVKAHNIYDIFESVAFSKSTVKVPRIYEWSSLLEKETDAYRELVNQFGTLDTPFQQMGVVIYNTKTGKRTKIRNPMYERIRHLRGNQPKIQYHYLCLRSEGKIGEFLRYFPENSETFSKFRDQVHEFTNTLFRNYVSCYMKKEKPLLEFSPQFRTHMFNLHQIYTTKLKENKQFVTNMVVIQYVNDMNPKLLMHSLRGL
jgi:hypothetical protein